jgi:hypothetical protein
MSQREDPLPLLTEPGLERLLTYTRSREGRQDMIR